MTAYDICSYTLFAICIASTVAIVAILAPCLKEVREDIRSKG